MKRKRFGQRGRQRQRRGTSGSLTIELALLMPVILAVILYALYACLYFHDRAVIAAAASEAAQRGRLEAVENENLYTGNADWRSLEQKGIFWRFPGQADGILAAESAEAAWYAGLRTAGKLTVCGTPHFAASATTQSMTVSWSCSVRAAGFLPWGMFSVFPEISGSVTVSGAEQEEILRIIHALEVDRQVQ